MSSDNLPFDPTGPDPGLVDPFAGMAPDEFGAAAAAGQVGQPSAAEQEQMRQYLAQLRGAPVTAVVAQVLQVLLDAAQVKMGRRDARLVLDLVTLIKDQAGSYLDEQLVAQIEQAIPQLQVGQVEAEGQLQQARATGQYSDADDPNDLEEYNGLADAPPPSAPSPPSAASRLWTPGTPGGRVG